jgi:hypothetical protein
MVPGLTLLALLHAEEWQVYLGMCLVGAGIGLSFAAAPALITGAVRQSETGVANGINAIMRSIGGILGGQICVALIVTWTLAGTTAPSEIGFTAGFWTCAIVCLLGVVAALFVRTSRASEPALAAAD